jgi:phage/plasmid primase-like uncharacterized protein/phage/plasmid-associated DNA primase
MELVDKLKFHKISIEPHFNQGMMRAKSQWLIAREFEVAGLKIQVVHFGDWKGDRGTWCSHDIKKLPKEARAAVEKAEEEHLAAYEADKLERHEQVAKEAEEMWACSTDRGTHPYLERKKLAGLHGTRVYVQEQGHPVLLVPMRDVAGRLWNVTRIYSKKFEGTNADKFILKGGRKAGLFHTLGEIRDASTVFITEGFATGCSVHEATGRAPTIIAFDAGNLAAVASELRGKYPGARFVFAADNDQWTKLPSGQPTNPGKEKALAAASLVGGTCVLPRFTDQQLEHRPTDFNDLHALAGLKEVEDQLTNPLKVIQEVVPLQARGKGKAARVSEKDVSESLTQYFQGKLAKHETDLFRYRDGFWQHMDFGERDKLKQLVAKLAPEFGITDIKRAIEYFVAHVPSPKGVNLFQPTPFAANFENGTLHVYRSGQGYKTEFREHNQEDYLTSKLPFAFPGVPGTPGYRGEVNAEFEAMLDRVWEGDEDIEDKKRLYKQVLGACLIPLFPVIVLAVGKPGTGKSTLLKLMRRLVSEENISTVDPSNFHGFLMESMVGKLLNINTDIDLSVPMKDAAVKAIIDRLPVQVNRKNMRVINAYIPAVHAFAGNGLPKTLDGESRAYERRMVIIKTDKFQPAGEYDKEFDQFVWETNPAGIVCAAVEGLFDLIAHNGHYLKLESGRKLVREMQERNDPVATFLRDVEAGHVRDKNSLLRITEGGKVERSLLWACFEGWKEKEDRATREFGRNKFFRQLEARGFTVTKVQGLYFFHGLTVDESEGSKW